MKKTLTVNLGGTVFHIDEDAYQLLDKYLSNLRVHFSKEEGSDEILNDFEMRIAELFNERIRLGYDVITIFHVEEVIRRMGKPEELFGEDYEKEPAASNAAGTRSEDNTQKNRKRLYRDPDDRVLGGVAGGIAAYMGWDPSIVRLIWFALIFFFGVTLAIYLILWLIIPQAKTATEKLEMRGESVTLENIGKTVTDGFENVNDYINSDKPRSAFRKVVDVLVQILGVFLKVLAAILIIALFPPLLLALFVIVVVLFALIAGGTHGIMNLNLPFHFWDSFGDYSPSLLFANGFSALLLIGIPLVSAIYALCGYIFKWKPVSNGLKWALIIVWFFTLFFNLFLASRYGMPFHHDWGWSW